MGHEEKAYGSRFFKAFKSCWGFHASHVNFFISLGPTRGVKVFQMDVTMMHKYNGSMDK